MFYTSMVLIFAAVHNSISNYSFLCISITRYIFYWLIFQRFITNLPFMNNGHLCIIICLYCINKEQQVWFYIINNHYNIDFIHILLSLEIENYIFFYFFKQCLLSKINTYGNRVKGKYFRSILLEYDIIDLNTFH